MGFLSKMLVAGLVGAGINKIRKNIVEENNRKSTPCHFDDGISQYEFNVIAKRAGKRIKRLTDLTINGAIVYGTVQSQSGISDWCFTIDFNDYGHITGAYWLSSDNNDSNIPSILADSISAAIKTFPECVNYTFEDEVDIEEDLEYEVEAESAYCPYCGKKVNAVEAKFCAYCGKRFRS